MSQEIFFKTSKSYNFTYDEFLPILTTNYFELEPLCKKVNEVNENRSEEEKLKNPRPRVSETFTFDKVGNVTLDKSDHQEL